MASLKDFFPDHLYTPRLILDLYNPTNHAHQDCLLASMNSSTAYERMGDFGVRTRKDLQTMLGRSLLRDARFGHTGVADAPCAYMLRRRDDGDDSDDGALIGVVTLAQKLVNGGEGMLPPHIGWALLEPFMRAGYATEAAAEVLRQVREGYKPPLGVMVFPSEVNPQSNRVAEKLGFVPGGECKDLDHPGKMMSLWILPGMERVDSMLKDGVSFKLAKD